MGRWTGTRVAKPRNLLPVDPATRAERRARHVGARVVRDARLQPRRRAPLLRVRPAGGHAQREHPLDRPRDRHPQPRHLRRGLCRGRGVRAGQRRPLHEHDASTRPGVPHDDHGPRGAAIPRLRGRPDAARPSRGEAAGADRERRRAQDGFDVRPPRADRRQPEAAGEEAERSRPGGHVPADRVLDVARRHRAGRGDDLRRRVERDPARAPGARRSAAGGGSADSAPARGDPAHPEPDRLVRAHDRVPPRRAREAEARGRHLVGRLRDGARELQLRRRLHLRRHRVVRHRGGRLPPRRPTSATSRWSRRKRRPSSIEPT